MNKTKYHARKRKRNRYRSRRRLGGGKYTDWIYHYIPKRFRRRTRKEAKAVDAEDAVDNTKKQKASWLYSWGTIKNPFRSEHTTESTSTIPTKDLVHTAKSREEREERLLGAIEKKKEEEKEDKHENDVEKSEYSDAMKKEMRKNGQTIIEKYTYAAALKEEARNKKNNPLVLTNAIFDDVKIPDTLYDFLARRLDEKKQIIQKVTGNGTQFFNYYMSLDLEHDPFFPRVQRERMEMLHELGNSLFENPPLQLSEVDLNIVCSDLYILMHGLYNKELRMFIEERFIHRKILVEFVEDLNIFRYYGTISGPEKELKNYFLHKVGIVQISDENKDLTSCFLEKFKAPPFYIETFLPVTVATQTFISENCKNDENMRRVFYIGPETT